LHLLLDVYELPEVSTSSGNLDAGSFIGSVFVGGEGPGVGAALKILHKLPQDSLLE
jgi:hypothetical protein